MKKVIVASVLVVLAIVVGVAFVGPTSAIQVAHDRQVDQDQIVARHRAYGLYCWRGNEPCDDLVARADKNEALGAAFQEAQNLGVFLYPENAWPFTYAGSVEIGRININVNASDEKIIKFLTE